MLHTTSLSFIFSKTLYARDVKELIPTHGIDEKSQKAFVVAIPIRKPVKEPGPISQVINSISFKLKLVWLKAFLIIGIKFSECVRPVLVSRLIIDFLSSKIETPHTSLAVSILNIFKINPPLIQLLKFYYFHFYHLF